MATPEGEYNVSCDWKERKRLRTILLPVENLWKIEKKNATHVWKRLIINMTGVAVQ